MLEHTFDNIFCQEIVLDIVKFLKQTHVALSWKKIKKFKKIEIFSKLHKTYMENIFDALGII